MVLKGKCKRQFERVLKFQHSKSKPHHPSMVGKKNRSIQKGLAKKNITQKTSWGGCRKNTSLMGGWQKKPHHSEDIMGVLQKKPHHSWMVCRKNRITRKRSWIGCRKNASFRARGYHCVLELYKGKGNHQ
jgi:hypothetical protein